MIAGFTHPSAYGQGSQTRADSAARLTKHITSLQLEHKLQIDRIIEIFRILNDSSADVTMCKTIFVINIIIYMCLQHSHVL